MEFDVFNIPLKKGVTRIEANAGTGKTYTLEKLVVRLIKEQGLQPSELLLLTFSNKAAAELRQRIFDNFRLNEPIITHGSDAGTSVPVIDFDDFTISTFHGFFNKFLLEISAVSGLRRYEKIVGDTNPLLMFITHDFIRKFTYRNYLGGVYFAQVFGTHERLLNDVMKPLEKYPRLSLPNTVNRIEDLTEHLTGITEAFQKLQKTLEKERSELEAFFSTATNINGKHFKSSSLKKLLTQINGLVRTAFLFNPDKWEYGNLSPTKIDTALKDGISHGFRFFGELKEYQKLLFQQKELCLSYLHQLIHQQLPAQASERGIITYNLLQSESLSALESTMHPSPKQILRDKFKAVLIDEYQDIDNIQNEFISSVFLGEDNYIYFVGDPKQSIYRFRGADLFSYSKLTTNDNSASYTLTTNRRSVELLINSVNKIFSGADSPFLYDEILPYHPSATPVSEQSTAEDIIQFGRSHRFAVTLLQGGKEKKSYEQEIVNSVCSSIFDLLKYGTDDRNKSGWKPRNIAVLVRRKKDGALIKKQLIKIGIPAQLQFNHPLFETDEAKELYALFSSVLSVGRPSALPTAMSLKLLNFTSKDIERLTVESGFGDEIAERFFRGREIFTDQGIFQTFEYYNKAFQLEELILGQEDGKVIWQNLEEMIRYLNQSEQEENLDSHQLLKLFSRLISGEIEGAPQATHDLSAESVRIMTIHSSKGLEFPAVFLPLIKKKSPPDPIKIFHDPANGFTPSLMRAENIKDYTMELEAEERRLFYVALTRASKVCEVTLHESNIEYRQLLKPLYEEENSPVLFRSIPDTKVMLPDEKYDPLEGEIQQLIQQSDYVAKSFFAKEKYSFTKLMRSMGSGRELASISSDEAEKRIQDTESELTLPTQDESDDICTLPAGSSFGELIHAMFENIDFKQSVLAEANQEVLVNAINKAGFDINLLKPISDLVDNVMTKDIGLTHTPGLILSDIHNDLKISEMFFSFKVEDIPWHKLAEKLDGKTESLFSENLALLLKELKQDSYHGFLTGFVDLMFEHGGKLYILDWKSNFLGTTPKDYNQKGMLASMQEHRYFLQMFLYAEAAERYFRNRFKSHEFPQIFGGAYYLFARGIRGNEGDTGIFFVPGEQIAPYIALN